MATILDLPYETLAMIFKNLLIEKLVMLQKTCRHLAIPTIRYMHKMPLSSKIIKEYRGYHYNPLKLVLCDNNIEYFPKIKKIYFYNCKINYNVISRFKWDNIIVLHINESNINNFNLSHILTKVPLLKDLSVINCKNVSEKFLQYITNPLRTLRLDIKYVKQDDVSKNFLTGVTNFIKDTKNLEHLQLSNVKRFIEVAVFDKYYDDQISAIKGLKVLISFTMSFYIDARYIPRYLNSNDFVKRVFIISYTNCRNDNVCSCDSCLLLGPLNYYTPNECKTKYCKCAGCESKYIKNNIIITAKNLETFVFIKMHCFAGVPYVTIIRDASPKLERICLYGLVNLVLEKKNFHKYKSICLSYTDIHIFDIAKLIKECAVLELLTIRIDNNWNFGDIIILHETILKRNPLYKMLTLKIHSVNADKLGKDSSIFGKYFSNFTCRYCAHMHKNPHIIL